MPTFYFHIRDGSGTAMKDEEGADLADAAARGAGLYKLVGSLSMRKVQPAGFISTIGKV